jgi:hypothetical protein
MTVIGLMLQAQPARSVSCVLCSYMSHLDLSTYKMAVAVLCRCCAGLPSASCLVGLTSNHLLMSGLAANDTPRCAELVLCCLQDCPVPAAQSATQV